MSALRALQGCLDAEHTAVYGYGVVGGVLAGTSGADERGYAAASYVAHRTRRDELIELIAGLGAEPAVAQPIYATPFPVSDAGACRRLAAVIERRTAATYAYAVSETVGELRGLLAAALTDAAVREVRWGGDVVPFPGAPDL